MPLTSRTRATLRSAEFGFLGVVVYTRVHTPRFCGLDLSAGAPVFVFTRRRPWRTSWFRVGTLQPPEEGHGFVRAGDARPATHRGHDAAVMAATDRGPEEPVTLETSDRECADRQATASANEKHAPL